MSFLKAVALLFLIVLIIGVYGTFAGSIESALSIKSSNVNVVSPERGFLPANYTHYLTIVERYNTPALENKLAYNVASEVINDTTVRIYSYYQAKPPALSIVDLNLYNLSTTTRCLITQYYNTPVGYVTRLLLNNTYYPTAIFFKGDKSLILGTWDYKGKLILARYVDENIKIVSFNKTWGRTSGLIIISILDQQNNSSESYIVDLGAVDNRISYTGSISGILSLNDLPLSSFARAYYSNGKLYIVETSLSWPGTPIGNKYIDYVGMQLNNNASLLGGLAGVIVGVIPIDSPDDSSAFFIYNKDYNSTGKAIKTSDGGYLVLLASDNKILLSKTTDKLNTEWSIQLESPFPWCMEKPFGFINAKCQGEILLTETSNGYALTLPINGNPLLIFFDKSGNPEWAWIHNETHHEQPTMEAEMTSYENQIILRWYYGVSKSVTGVFDTNGTIIAVFSDDRMDSILYNRGLITGLKGKLFSSEPSLISRPDGYVNGEKTVTITILAGLLTSDFLSAEMIDINPFKNWRTNEDKWIKINLTTIPLKMMKTNETISILKYKQPLIINGSREKELDFGNTSMLMRTIGVKTILHETNKIETIPSFLYPIILAPKEVDFGEVHVGENKTVQIDLTWLVQLLESPRVIYNDIESILPFYYNHEQLESIFEQLMETDVDVGKHFRLTLSFQPTEEGSYTKTLVFALAPGGWDDVISQTTITLKGIGVAKEKPIDIGIILIGIIILSIMFLFRRKVKT